ncbi:MAG: dihydrolipoamide acetyltransferase family protein [Bacteroidota bacterium]|nr:dihydrolipoamide acetyltransferase family protein [Bacteroidota bacterium]
MATQVILPRQGQSVESCIITEIMVKKGDSVKQGDLLMRYETDKAVFELEADEEGFVLDVLCEEGDEVLVLATVLVVGEEGEEYEEIGTRDLEIGTRDLGLGTRDLGLGTRGDELPVAERSRSLGAIIISPRAKRLAGKLGVPYQQLTGSGPEGRIIERDIEAYVKSGGRLTVLAGQMATETGLEAPAQGSGLGGRFLGEDLQSEKVESRNDFTLMKLSNIRKIIAQKMHASLQNSAQLTHHMSADARKMLSIRKAVKQKIESEGGENITLNDLVCLSVIRALKNMPEINSHFQGDTIKTFNKVHLGIAVDTDRGLMVPALRNADDLTIEQLSKQLKQLANSCKTGSIDPDLLAPTAASFTVSNLGSFGVEMFTPVINLPQSGILGVNTIIQRPGDIGDGIIGFIPYIGLSLTYDHRVIDGAPASAFLREIKEQIENLNINL